MADNPQKMVYNFLGNSGLKVSNICLGTMTFGIPEGCSGPRLCNEQESHAILDCYKEAGGNFIDTANVYTNGLSEEIVGRWLARQKREHFVIATKVCGTVDAQNPNGLGLSRFHIMNAVNESLKRLQTNYIDLYQTHHWDDGTPIEETLYTMNNLVCHGKVRYFGVSNVLGWQMQKIIDLCKFKNWAPPISLQQQWNLLTRETEYELVQACRNEGIGILPWSPLKGGLLSGKYTKESMPAEEGCRLVWVSQNKEKATQCFPLIEDFNNDKTWNLLALMEDIANTHGKCVSQVAIRWLLQKDTVPSVVVGAKSVAQLQENMGASSGWNLSAEEMTMLDEASAPVIPYPYETVWRLNKKRQK